MQGRHSVWLPYVFCVHSLGVWRDEQTWLKSPPKEDAPLLKSHGGCIWIRKLLDMVRAWHRLDVWKITPFLRLPSSSLRSHLGVILNGQSENLVVAFHRNLLNIFPTGFMQNFLMWNNFALSTISENTSCLQPCLFSLITQSLWWFLLCFTLKSHLFESQFWCLVTLCSWVLKLLKTQWIWHHSCWWQIKQISVVLFSEAPATTSNSKG